MLILPSPFRSFPINHSSIILQRRSVVYADSDVLQTIKTTVELIVSLRDGQLAAKHNRLSCRTRKRRWTGAGCSPLSEGL